MLLTNFKPTKKAILSRSIAEVEQYGRELPGVGFFKLIYNDSCQIVFLFQTEFSEVGSAALRRITEQVSILHYEVWASAHVRCETVQMLKGDLLNEPALDAQDLERPGFWGVIGLNNIGNEDSNSATASAVVDSLAKVLAQSSIYLRGWSLWMELDCQLLKKRHHA